MFTPLVLTHLSSMEDYKIVEIDRKSVFAGKLGRLVHESIVVERDGARITIHIRGDYHTACVHPNQRLHEGDTVRMPDGLRDGMRVDRDSIRR